MEKIQTRDFYHKVDNLAENTFKLVFALKMEKVIEKVTLNQVIKRVHSKLPFHIQDTTKQISEMREKEYVH